MEKKKRGGGGEGGEANFINCRWSFCCTESKALSSFSTFATARVGPTKCSMAVQWWAFVHFSASPARPSDTRGKPWWRKQGKIWLSVHLRARWCQRMPAHSNSSFSLVVSDPPHHVQTCKSTPLNIVW